MEADSDFWIIEDNRWCTRSNS